MFTVEDFREFTQPERQQRILLYNHYIQNGMEIEKALAKSMTADLSRAYLYRTPLWRRLFWWFRSLRGKYS